MRCEAELPLGLQGEYRVTGGGITHELADIGFRVAIFVERPCGPGAGGSVLIGLEPGDASGDMAICRGIYRNLFEHQHDEAGGIAVRASFKGCVVDSFPGAKIGEAPAAVGVLDAADILSQLDALATLGIRAGKYLDAQSARILLSRGCAW